MLFAYWLSAIFKGYDNDFPAAVVYSVFAFGPAGRALRSSSAHSVALAVDTNLTWRHRSRLMTKSIQITSVWQQGEGEESSGKVLNKKERLFGPGRISGRLVCPLMHGSRPCCLLNKVQPISEDVAELRLLAVCFFFSLPSVVGPENKTEFALKKKMPREDGVALVPRGRVNEL